MFLCRCVSPFSLYCPQLLTNKSTNFLGLLPKKKSRGNTVKYLICSDSLCFISYVYFVYILWPKSFFVLYCLFYFLYISTDLCTEIYIYVVLPLRKQSQTFLVVLLLFETQLNCSLPINLFL